MSTTTDTIPGAETRPFDFTALFAERDTVRELATRLQFGDRSAIADARPLVDAYQAKVSQAEAAIAAAGVAQVSYLDAVNELVSGFGYGELELWLDVIEGRQPHPEAPDVEMLQHLAANGGSDQVRAAAQAELDQLDEEGTTKTLTVTLVEWRQLVAAPASRENLRRMRIAIDERFGSDDDSWEAIEMRGELIKKLTELAKAKRLQSTD